MKKKNPGSGERRQRSEVSGSDDRRQRSVNPGSDGCRQRSEVSGSGGRRQRSVDPGSDGLRVHNVNLRQLHWITAFGVILALSVAAALLLRLPDASIAKIYHNGTLIETIDLSAVIEPYSFPVESESGVNVVSVSRGQICVSDASCPDKLCVRQGWVSGASLPIVCLPNNLVIKLEGGAAPGVDAVVG